MRTRHLLLLASIAALITACSGSGTASPTVGGGATEAMTWAEGQPTPDGCTVITPEEVSSASGFEIVSAMAMQSGEPGCGYYDADGLVLSTRFHQLATTGQSHLDAELARAPLEVPGVGERAIWIERGWQLWATQGQTLVMMGIGRIGETPERLELAKKLGPLVVERFD